ncbi:hypothetical protein BsWGS_11469 [Bradybaena similaris]
MEAITNHQTQSATNDTVIVFQEKHSNNAVGYDTFSQQPVTSIMFSNHYGMRKAVSQALMDVALMMVNISQLRTLLTSDDDIDFRLVLTYLVSFSLGFQILFAIVLYTIWIREYEQRQKDKYLKKSRKVAKVAGRTNTAAAIEAGNSKGQTCCEGRRITSILSYVSMALAFAITVINMFITGFGIEVESPEGCVKKTNSS